MPSIPSIPSVGGVGQHAGPTAPTPTQPTPQNSPFTVDRFNSAWTGLAQLFPEDPRLAAVFAHNTPELSEDHLSCLLTLANPWQHAEVKSRLRFIESELHKRLQNDQLHIRLQIAEYTPQMDSLTMEDRYKVMAEKNPQLVELKNRLGLQIE